MNVIFSKMKLLNPFTSLTNVNKENLTEKVSCSFKYF